MKGVDEEIVCSLDVDFWGLFMSDCSLLRLDSLVLDCCSEGLVIEVRS